MQNEQMILIMDRHAKLKAELLDIKKQFEFAITDQTVSLRERWILWNRAPSELKNHQNDYWDVKCANLKWWNSNYERHSTIYTVDIVDNARYVIENGGRDSELEMYKDFINDPDLVEALKEEILQLNLRSFEYDW